MERNPQPIDDDYINVFPDLQCQSIVCAHRIKSYHSTCTYINANNIFSWMLDTNTVVTRNEIFTVFNRADHRKNDALNLLSKILLKYYWDCKQRFCLPNLENAKVILRSEFNTLKLCNKKIRTIFDNSGIDLNRE